VSTKQILLVESDPKQLRLVRASLEGDGYAVTTAEDGKAALVALESRAFDLVLSATSLPRLDGFELVEHMQEHDEWQNIPTVLMIDGDVRAARMRGVRLGIEEFLTKPVFVKEVSARVRVLLAKQARERLSGAATSGNVSGTLEELPVVDLLESVAKGRQSGTAVFRAHSTTATVYFRRGEIVDATLKRLRGEEAVYRLLTWREGRYDVTLGPSARAAVVELETSTLLETGLRQAEEFHVLAESLPPLEAILEVDFPRLRSLADEVPDSIEALLRLFDGKRTLFEIVDDSPFDDRSTLRTLMQLHDEGVLIGAEDLVEQPVPLSRASAAGHTLRPTSEAGGGSVRLGRSEAPPVDLGAASREEEPESSPVPDASATTESASPFDEAEAPQPVEAEAPQPVEAEPTTTPSEEEVPDSRRGKKASRKNKRSMSGRRGKDGGALDERDSLRSPSPLAPPVAPTEVAITTRNETLRVTSSEPPPRDSSAPSPVAVEESEDEATHSLSESGVSNVFFSHPPPSMSEDGRPQDDVDDDGEVYLTDEQIDRRSKNRRLVLGIVGLLGAVGLAAAFLPSLGGGHAPPPPATTVVRATPPGPAASTPTSRSSGTALTNAPASAAPTSSSSAEPAASASALASSEASPEPSAAPTLADGEGDLPDVPDPLKAAMKKLDVGNYAEAIRFAKAAVKKDPENADGYFALFTAYDSIGKAADASKAREACAANAKKGQYKGYCPSPKKPVAKKKKKG